jgi:hypothetical protein
MNEKPMPEKKGEDIDISDFFRLIGRGINKVGLFIKSFFLLIYNFFISLFLFLKKKIVWLIIGAAAGAALGTYALVNGGATYISTMTVRSNFDNNYFLYNQLDYFNSLIRNNRYAELSKEFKITEPEARTLISFVIRPEKNELEAARLYRDAFLDFKRNRFVQDTIWSKTLRFKDFQKNLTDIDYPIQHITFRSSNADIYPKIQDGIYQAVNNNAGLIKRWNTELAIRAQEETLLKQSLTSLDTLRQVYNKNLAREANNNASGTAPQFFMNERSQRTPELDIYDKTLLIKDELATLQHKSAENAELLQVYAGFNKVGTRQSGLRQLVYYTLFGFLAVFALLVFIEFTRFLSRVEKTKLQKPTPPTTPTS